MECQHSPLIHGRPLEQLIEGREGKLNCVYFAVRIYFFARVNQSVRAALTPSLVTVTYDNSSGAPKWNFSMSNMAFTRFYPFI